MFAERYKNHNKNYVGFNNAISTIVDLNRNGKISNEECNYLLSISAAEFAEKEVNKRIYSFSTNLDHFFQRTLIND